MSELVCLLQNKSISVLRAGAARWFTAHSVYWDMCQKLWGPERRPRTLRLYVFQTRHSSVALLVQCSGGNASFPFWFLLAAGGCGLAVVQENKVFIKLDVAMPCCAINAPDQCFVVGQFLPFYFLHSVVILAFFLLFCYCDCEVGVDSWGFVFC